MPHTQKSKNKKNSPVLWRNPLLQPIKNHNFTIPQNIHYFESPQNIQIQNVETKKINRAYVYMKISESPPLPWHMTPEQRRINVQATSCIDVDTTCLRMCACWESSSWDIGLYGICVKTSFKHSFAAT